MTFIAVFLNLLGPSKCFIIRYFSVLLVHLLTNITKYPSLFIKIYLALCVCIGMLENCALLTWTVPSVMAVSCPLKLGADIKSYLYTFLYCLSKVYALTFVLYIIIFSKILLEYFWLRKSLKNKSIQIFLLIFSKKLIGLGIVIWEH